MKQSVKDSLMEEPVFLSEVALDTNKRINYKHSKFHLFILFSVLIYLSSCNIKPPIPTPQNNKTSIDSIQIIKKTYKNSPNVVEYEFPVIKGTNKRHGIQKRFYLHGSIYSEIPYINGKREGTALTYYPADPDNKPAIWKEQSFVNNMLDGICKRYHRNGTLQAEYEYKNGLPAIGMKEFSESGQPVKLPYLILTKNKTYDGYYVTARLSNNLQMVDYYIGNLVEGKYLPEGLKGLQVKKGIGEIVVSNTTKSVTISAVYISRFRNKCIISKTINM